VALAESAAISAALRAEEAIPAPVHGHFKIV
jgi:hypothetical protein